MPSTSSREIERLCSGLPPGRALDVAGGAGRHAIWLARRGWRVTVADVSPAGLALAREHAAEAGVTIVTTEADFESGVVPGGPWELLLVHHYLSRPLLRVAATALAPGGHLAVVHPTLTNLERNPRPSARFLLADGELAELVSTTGLEIVSYEEGWTDAGRHEARLLAQRAVDKRAGRR